MKKVWQVTSILLVSLFAAASQVNAQTTADSVVDLRKQLDEPWTAKDWIKVEALSRQIIASGQANTGDYRILRVALNNQGKTQEALQLQLSIVQRADAKSSDQNSMCWDYLKQNMPTEALPYCQKALDLQSNNWAALVNFGHIWLLKGEQNKAYSSYRKALNWIDKENDLKNGPLDDFNYFVKQGWASSQAQAAKIWFEQAWVKKQQLENMIGEVAKLSGKDGQEPEAMRLALKSIEDSTALLEEDAWSYVRVFGRLYMSSAAKLAQRKSLPDINESSKKTLRGAYDTVAAQIDVGDMMEFWNGLGRAHRMQDHNATALDLHQTLLALLQRLQLPTDDGRILDTMVKIGVDQFNLGHFDDARIQDEKVLAVRRVKLGVSHPDTLASMETLSLDYYTLQQYAKAQALLEEYVPFKVAQAGQDDLQAREAMARLVRTQEILRKDSKFLKTYSAETQSAVLTLAKALRQKDAELKQILERERQMDEALGQMDALFAAIQESLDPKCKADDLSPSAPSRRKELAIVIDKALHNPLIAPKLMPNSVALWGGLADKLRLGQNRERFTPDAMARFTKQFDLGETRCAPRAR